MATRNGRAAVRTAVGVAADSQAEFSIIPREKLQALYDSLLKNAAVRDGKSAGGKRGKDWAAVEAAGPAVCLDLKGDDLVLLGEASEKLRAAAGLGKTKDRRGAEERLPPLIGKTLAYKMQKTGRVGVAFWREADEQPCLDAMEIARAHGLPIVFVSPPLSEASAKQLASFATGPGTELPTITVDGNDPVAVYRVAHESIERARRGRGATLIECGQFRTPGVKRVDAVNTMKRYMKAKGLKNGD
jgi:pyruvate dehydrogenase E1 component alpha subunit